jgi:hypothetical protein
MKRVLAIAGLTFAEGVRMRIVLVFLLVLLFLVLRMPFALRGDDTLTGRLQNFLSYSLAALSLLMSFATVFFSCSTLTTELRERSLHLVVTKPVSRFQILLGKWLGVNLLNVLIVVLGGAAIYGFASYIRSRPVQFERDRVQVRDVVWTARVAASPTPPRAEMEAAAEERVKARLAAGEITNIERNKALGQALAELESQWRTVESGGDRVFRFDNLAPPADPDTALQVRFRIRATPLPPSERVPVLWGFFDPESGAPLAQKMTEERSGNRHQFLVRAGPLVKNGQVLLQVANPPSIAGYNLYFEGDDALQVLFQVGSFEVNLIKALAMILMQLGLLSALGLFFGVFVSFPVACLCTSVFLLISLALPFILESIGANLELITPQSDPYGTWGRPIRFFLVPFMKFVFPDLAYYNGGRYLVDGEYIPLTLLTWCAARTVVFGAALLLLPGWLIFASREVAEVTV